MKAKPHQGDTASSLTTGHMPPNPISFRCLGLAGQGPGGQETLQVPRPMRSVWSLESTFFQPHLCLYLSLQKEPLVLDLLLAEKVHECSRSESPRLPGDPLNTHLHPFLLTLTQGLSTSGPLSSCAL